MFPRLSTAVLFRRRTVFKYEACAISFGLNSSRSDYRFNVSCFHTSTYAMASSYANRFSLPAPSFSKPASLEVARGKNESKDVGTVLRAALSIGGFYRWVSSPWILTSICTWVLHEIWILLCKSDDSEESVLQRAADRLYHSIVCQTEDSDVLDTFSVEQNFQGLLGLIVLHVWMLLSRLRSEGAAGKELSQAIYHVFLDDVERRLHSDGLRVKVQNMLRELEQSFFGSVVSCSLFFLILYQLEFDCYRGPREACIWWSAARDAW